MNNSTLSGNISNDRNIISGNIQPNSVILSGSINPGTGGGNQVHTDTTENWNLQRDFIGKRNHIYVYSDYTVIDGIFHPAIKIGDGSTYLIDLPFVVGDNTDIRRHIQNTTIHITEDERLFWNDKVTCFLSNGDSETVVFTKEQGELNG